MPLIDSNTVFLLHGDNAQRDASKNKFVINVNGVVTSRAEKKFHDTSLYFDGASNILFKYSHIAFGANDFTIDWWEYALTGAKSRFSTSWEDWGGLLLGFQGTHIYAGTTLHSWNIGSNTAAFTVDNKWVHWALTRHAGKYIIYKDGKKFKEFNFNAGAIWNGKGTANIGGYCAPYPDWFKGYMDEFRISNIVRWTSDFTPPTEPYKDPNDNPAYIKVNGVWKSIDKPVKFY